MFNVQFSMLNVQLLGSSANSYHAPVVNFFRVKMLKVGSELAAELFCFAPDILMYQWNYIFSISQRRQKIGFFFGK